MKVFGRILSFSGSVMKQNISMSAEQDRQIAKLPCAEDASHTSHLWEQKPRCLPTTRVKLLDLVGTWCESPQSPCIFWLQGMAGTGKSTIARTVADNFAKQKKLGASFFFSRGRGDLGYAKKFFSTIAVQLACKVPLLRDYISKAIYENPQVVSEGRSGQWKHLILQPLICWERSLLQHDTRSPESRILVLVIDALDECDDEDDDVRLLLRLLAESRVLQKVRLRVFITSRPETTIRFGFKNIPGDTHQDYALHDIDKGITEQDISVFLSHELEEIRKLYDIGQGWPAGNNIRILAQKANGLFIYAATACRILRSSKVYPPEDQLKLLLQGSTNSKSPDGAVDEIYSQVLKYSLVEKGDNEERAVTAECFRGVVGPIVILFDPLSYISLAELIGVPPHSVLAILDNLRSVLDVPASQDHPIQLLHPSFRDFLLRPDRCLHREFCVDGKATQKHILLKCIRLMSMYLKQDMCELGLPGALPVKVDKGSVKKHIPAHLQYACLYWVHHLIRSDIMDDDLNEAHLFIQEKLLYWIETLSLIRKASDCIQMVTTLESFVVSDPRDFRWSSILTASGP